jgi:uncharacterized membrane protein YozB (DUF420 family)
MQKPDKKSYRFYTIDYAITLTGGIATGLIASIIGFMIGGVVNGLPSHPFEVISMMWIIIPSIIGYFVPLVWDLIGTRASNKHKRELYASDLAAYNSYLETTQKREFESFIKECKS